MGMVAGGAAGDGSTSIGDGSSDNSSSDTSSRSSKGRWKDSKTAGDLRSMGSSLQSAGKDESDRADSISESIRPVQYHSGGKVRKTGPAILKRGERVIPAGKRKKVERLMKRSGIRMKSRGRSKAR